MFFFTYSLGYAQESTSSDQVSRLNSLQKSLLVPGWGQIAEKKYVKGLFFMGTELFCIINILSDNHKANKNYEAYKEAVHINDAVSFRALTEKYDGRRNRFLAAAVGIWILNMIDIYFIVKNKQKKKRNLWFSLESASKKTLSLTISLRF